MITTIDRRAIYAGDGVNADFAYTYKVHSDDHLKVFVGGVDSSISVHGRNADQESSPGGILTMAVAPVDLSTVVVMRVMPETQTTDYTPYGSFPSDSHEARLDEIIMSIQEHSDELSRALVAPIDDDGTTDYTLPAPEADKILAWNTTGDGLENAASVSDVIAAAAAAAASEAAAAASEAAAAASETNAATSEINAAASAASINLPIIAAGDEGKTIQVNSTLDGYEFVNPGRKHKTADTTKNSDTTLDDDPHLAGWALEADSIYKIEGLLVITAAATPDIKLGLKVSQIPQSGHWVPSHSPPSETAVDTTPATYIWGGSAGTLTILPIVGYVHTHATLATTLDLQWAQNVSDAGDSTILLGSWVNIEKIG